MTCFSRDFWRRLASNQQCDIAITLLVHTLAMAAEMKYTNTCANHLRITRRNYIYISLISDRYTTDGAAGVYSFCIVRTSQYSVCSVNEVRTQGQGWAPRRQPTGCLPCFTHWYGPHGEFRDLPEFNMWAVGRPNKCNRYVVTSRSTKRVTIEFDTTRSVTSSAHDQVD